MTSQLDADLQARLRAIFGVLNRRGAEHAWPPPLSLRHEFESILRRRRNAEGDVEVGLPVSKLFATAAVDAWHRGVHGFLISASLTSASPIWASVSGYYASHYCVRALAHLLGHFSLHHSKFTVRLGSVRTRTQYITCTLKKGRAREHLFYWKVVKGDPCFAQDPLFTENPEDGDVSDAAHRNYANYADHLDTIAVFRALDEPSVRNRVQSIAQIPFTAPPIPSRDRWPDLESVQVVAYHRIVAFRRVLDDVLGGSNRFWNVHRTPTWSSGAIDFQLTEQAGLASDRLGQVLGG